MTETYKTTRYENVFLAEGVPDSGVGCRWYRAEADGKSYMVLAQNILVAGDTLRANGIEPTSFLAKARLTDIASLPGCWLILVERKGKAVWVRVKTEHNAVAAVHKVQAQGHTVLTVADPGLLHDEIRCPRCISELDWFPRLVAEFRCRAQCGYKFLPKDHGLDPRLVDLVSLPVVSEDGELVIP